MFVSQHLTGATTQVNLSPLLVLDKRKITQLLLSKREASLRETITKSRRSMLLVDKFKIAIELNIEIKIIRGEKGGKNYLQFIIKVETALLLTETIIIPFSLFLTPSVGHLTAHPNTQPSTYVAVGRGIHIWESQTKTPRFTITLDSFRINP